MAAASRRTTQLPLSALVVWAMAAGLAAQTTPAQNAPAETSPAQTVPAEPATPSSRLDLGGWFSGSRDDTAPSRPWATGLSFDGGCVGCGGSLDAPRNPNAPWTAHAGITTTRGRSQLSVGVIGRRNHRFAQYLAQPIGTSVTGAPVMPAVTALTDMSQLRTDWQLTARVHRTLTRTASGKTVGVVADVFVPLSGDLAPAAAATPGMSSKAARIGLQFGF